jgi:hypothetical protein
MRVRRGYVLTFVAIGCVAIVVAFAVGLSLLYDGPSSKKASVTTLATQGEGSPVTPETANTVVAAIDANEFSSMAAAEAAAGFHIPAPSAYYPMAFGRTYLRRAQGGRGTFSTTQYTYPPLAPNSIGVDAGSAAVFNAQDFQQNESRTIGGRSGSLVRNDGTAIQFAFQYAVTDGVTLWCLVQGPGEMGLKAFQEFVGSLQ